MKTPKIINAKNIEYTKFTITWESILDANGYLLYISTDKDFKTHTTPYYEFDVKKVLKYTIKKNINDNTTYYCRIKAYDNKHNSRYSNIFEIRTLKFPIINSPTNLSVSNLHHNTFTLNWKQIHDASNYMIEISDDENFKNIIYENLEIDNVSSIKIDNLKQNTIYYCRLKSYNFEAVSNYSEIFKVKTLYSIPDAPIALKATNISQNSFNANWSEIDLVEENGSYLIDISLDRSFTKILLVWQNVNCKKENTRKINIGIKPNTTYYYRIKSKNNYGVSQYSNIINVDTLPNKPDKPSNITINNITSNSFRIEHFKPNFVNEYYIEISTDKKFKTILEDYNNKKTNDLNIEINNLLSNTEYYCRFRAYNNGGVSDYSKIYSVLTKKLAPITMFYSDVNVILTGQTVNYYDISKNNPTKYYWVFEKGTPQTSDLQNPSVIYNEEGIFDVKLVTENNGGYNEENKIGYIKVFNSPIMAQYKLLLLDNKIVKNSENILKKGPPTKIETFENLQYITFDSNFGQYINTKINYNTKSSDFTFGCFIKTSYNDIQNILSSNFLNIDIVNNKVIINIKFENMRNKKISSDIEYLDNNWHHILFTMNSKKHKLELYYDKKIILSKSVKYGIINNINNIYICKNKNIFYNGSIDEIFLSNSFVLESEINGLVGNNIVDCGDVRKIIKKNDLLFYYRFEDKTNIGNNSGKLNNCEIINNPQIFSF